MRWRGAGGAATTAVDAGGTAALGRAGARTILGAITTGVVRDVAGGAGECETCVRVRACGAGSGLGGLEEPEGAFCGAGFAAADAAKQLSMSRTTSASAPDGAGVRAVQERASVCPRYRCA